MFCDVGLVKGIKEFTERYKSKALKNSMILAVFIAMILSLGILVPEFWTFSNIMNVLQQTSTVGILALGGSFVLVAGGIDISLAATLTCSAIIGSMAMVNTQNVLLGIMTTMAAAVIFGLINGIAVAYLKMVPIIVTLSTMVIADGLGTMLCQSKSIYGLPDSFIDAFTSRFIGIPVSVIVLIVTVVFAWLLLNNSVYGRKLFAIGSNENAAIVCNINTRRVKLWSYLISSMSAGIVAVLLTARIGSAATSMASDSINMDVLSSAILGGVSIYGGKGNAFGAFLGAAFIVAFSNVVNLLGISYYPSLIIKGIIVIVIAYIDTLRAKR